MVVLYTIDCPKCKVLENKLNAKGIEYEMCKDKNEMMRLGISVCPVLSVDDKLLDFHDGNKWINEQEGNALV